VSAETETFERLEKVLQRLSRHLNELETDLRQKEAERSGADDQNGADRI